MNEPVVYADLTFLTNFAMDFIIIWAAARFSRHAVSWRRLFLASVLGGLYGTGFLFTELAFLYSLPAKAISSVLLILTAMWPINWQDFKKAILIFYGISLAAAGAVIAVAYTRQNAGYFSWSWLYLLGGMICAALIGIYGEKYIKQSLIPALLKYQVSIRFGHTCCNGEGFLDTGNGLRDPVTRRPIVVAEYELLKSCLPDDFKNAMESCQDENERLEAISMSTWGNRMRLIPFSSIGKKNGLLIGVRCDEMVVRTGKKEVLHKNLVVGIYPHKLSNEDSYQLLIPSEVVI